MSTKTDKPIRLTRGQENALVASVGWPPDSPAYGVILRGGHRMTRALTEVGLMSLRQKGLVAEWRTTTPTPGSSVTSVRLNERGIALAQEIARKHNPAWQPEPPQYAPLDTPDAIDWKAGESR